MKLAVLLLLGFAKAYPVEMDEEQMTLESIKEAERKSGKKIDFADKGMMPNALAENNRLNFDSEDFVDAKQLLQLAPHRGVRFYPAAGVRFVQQRTFSDPIYGSLGPPKIDPNDLTAEQQFELKQRTLKPVPIVLDKHMIDTENSIKTAEKIVGAKMPSPDDPEQKEKFARDVDTPFYHYHDMPAEETEDTVETRKSIKTAEKMYKHRFFINEKDRRRYQADVKAGLVDPKQASFTEDDDSEIGKLPKADKNAEANKAEEAADKKEKADKEAGGEKAEGAKEAAADKADAAAKDELPPELAGAAIQTKMEELGIKYPMYA